MKREQLYATNSVRQKGWEPFEGCHREVYKNDDSGYSSNSTFSAKTTELTDCLFSILLVWLLRCYTYKLAIICSIAYKILVAMVTTFENTSLATAKLAIL